SVAWVAERKDLLCALFFLLALAAYARYARTRSRWAYAGVVAAFLLGLLAKPMLVTLPFVLILLDAWPLRRTAPERWGRLLAEKTPLVALATASGTVTFL